jgi:predicted dehydrogenase
MLWPGCLSKNETPGNEEVFSANGRKLSIGVIGTGDRGKGLIQLMNKIGSFEIVACADVLPFRLEEGLKLAPRAAGYAAFEPLLNDPNVEAVIIATPFSTHDEIAIAALDAGKHIYCEKTMVKGISEIQSVLDKSQGSSLVFQTGHQYHSSPLYQRVRSMVLAGYVGDVTAYECQWNRNGSWRRPVPDPKFERLINWRMYREFSGGLAAELMSHQIDFINWVTGSHPEKMTGFGGIDHWKDGRETFDNAHLLAEYPSGMDASFTCTTTNGHEDYQIKILGSKATIILDYTHGEIYAENFDEKQKGVVDGVSGATLKAWKQGKGAPINAPGNDPTFDALKQFYDSVLNGSPVISDIKTGATTSKCVQMALDVLHGGEIKYWNDYPELNFG